MTEGTMKYIDLWLCGRANTLGSPPSAGRVLHGLKRSDRPKWRLKT